MTDKKNINWLNILRALSTISVIILHICIAILNNTPTFDFNWWITNIGESMVRFCVPVFLMISGALLFSSHYNLIEFLKKRILRIIPPLLFWSGIYLTAQVVFRFYSGSSAIEVEITEWVRKIFTTGISFHFWYVYLILGLYLFIPVIGKWSALASNKELMYFFILWIVTVINNLYMPAPFRLGIDLSYFTGYIGYMVIGYFIATRKINQSHLLGAILMALGVVITATGTFWISYVDGILSQDFYDYLSPNVIMMSIGTFLFFKDRQLKNSLIITICNYLCRYGLGIYLAHMLILSLLYKTVFQHLLTHALLSIPLLTIICTLASCLVVALINKVPVIGKYISG